MHYTEEYWGLQTAQRRAFLEKLLIIHMVKQFHCLLTECKSPLLCLQERATYWVILVKCVQNVQYSEMLVPQATT
jgi:hypothetical protein